MSNIILNSRKKYRFFPTYFLTIGNDGRGKNFFCVAVNLLELSELQEAMKQQTLMTYGVLACLKGLHEQGCNDSVTDAINKIEKYLNQAAHGQI